MSDTPRIHQYKNLTTLTRKLRGDVNSIQCILLFAYNRTGKTRLSMEFRNQGKRKAGGSGDTLFFNAYTEDLFVWKNDADHHLTLDSASGFLRGLTELALDETIAGYLSRYADFGFDIDYSTWRVTFRKGDDENIKISRGEENIFIWCVFMAICERVIDGHSSYGWVKNLYIDDPISSLDDSNAIAVACDLAGLVRKAASRRDALGAPDPLGVVISSHHALFFNVMCNELSRTPEGEEKVKTKRYFLHQPNSESVYTLRATDEAPFFHHVWTLAELRHCLESETLYTYHFNALRCIMEKTASFFGQENLRFCLQGMEDEALYNRAINLLSHGKYSFAEPVEMVEDNKKLFGRILGDFLDRFQFAIPDTHVGAPKKEKATT